MSASVLIGRQHAPLKGDPKQVCLLSGHLPEVHVEISLLCDFVVVSGDGADR